MKNYFKLKTWLILAVMLIIGISSAALITYFEFKDSDGDRIKCTWNLKEAKLSFFSSTIDSVMQRPELSLSGPDLDSNSPDIQGYDDYKLRCSLVDLDLSDFYGPLKDTAYGSIEGLVYNRSEIFYHTAGSTEVSISLVFINDVLELICLDFPTLFTDFKDLDRISLFVSGLRDTLLKKYDGAIIDGDRFSFMSSKFSSLNWEGGLIIKDSEGDILMLGWDGYDLQIFYYTAQIFDIVLGASSKAASEDEGKL